MIYYEPLWAIMSLWANISLSFMYYKPMSNYELIKKHWAYEQIRATMNKKAYKIIGHYERTKY